MHCEKFDFSIEALTGHACRFFVVQSPTVKAQKSVEFPLCFIPIQTPFI